MTNCKRSHQVWPSERLKINKAGYDPDNYELWKDLIVNLEEKLDEKIRLPDLCTHYNSTRGCNKGDKCPFIHMCKHLLASKCKNENNCEYSHNVCPKDANILRKNGLEGDITDLTIGYVQLKRKKVPPTNQNIRAKSGARPKNANFTRNSRSEIGAPVTSKVVTDQICEHFLRNACTHGDTCYKTHPKGKTPYVWRYKFESNDEWKQIDAKANEELEESFADPKNRSKSVEMIPGSQEPLTVDFETMRTEERSVQISRLAIDDIWVWYLEHAPEEWSEFGALFGNSQIASIDSSLIEMNFQRLTAQRPIEIKFIIDGDREGLDYTLRLGLQQDGTMKALAISSNGYIKPVCRRPKIIKEKPFEQTICDNHPNKPCDSVSCPMYRYKAADFLWVWKEKNSNKWKHFSVAIGTTLEKGFSLPNVTEKTVIANDKLKLTVSIDGYGELCKVTPENYEVKRLFYKHEHSTASAFAWYWKENLVSGTCLNALSELFELVYKENEKWIEYGEKGDKRIESRKKSSDIELQYQSHRSQSVLLDLNMDNSPNYLLNFLTLSQINTENGTIREIRRRLDLGPDRRVELELDQRMSGFIPRYWDNQKLDRAIGLTIHDRDYVIISSYCKTMIPEASSISVRRIESHNLWNIYCLRKNGLERTSKILPNKAVNETILFYPLRKPLTDSGINEIIEVSVSDIKDKSLGSDLSFKFENGTYFASDISTAIKHCDGDQGQRDLVIAFACRGRSGKGQSKSGPGITDRYDSFIDKDPPSIVVLPDSALFYPAYFVSILN